MNNFKNNCLQMRTNWITNSICIMQIICRSINSKKITMKCRCQTIIKIRITIISIIWGGNNRLKIQDTTLWSSSKLKIKKQKCTFTKMSNLMSSSKTMILISSECKKTDFVYLKTYRLF